ncbi:GNAT family N-acetyltransferase [Aquisediminimonas profunda]|uniref:GNAT family N-acetyltransferase n=1 Tax=Aquisediminimonas profunda TaxID=1550733 RepID=UPI001C624C57|nr:GNAT family N-acetyltransferase [Aquisediminimonas profunda]
MDLAVEPPFQIRPARSQLDVSAARSLFAEYAESLPVDLNYQDFGSEVGELPGKYAEPLGELLIAWDAKVRPVACVGMRPLHGDGICEMKRLYVIPEARSFGLGKLLTNTVIGTAKARGYVALRLDTLGTMNRATALYERMGFRRIEPYYGPTPQGTIFMELNLTR